MATVTISDVALIQAGTRAGPALSDGTITPADIASMAAGYANKMVDRIPIKIGHVDSRFQDGAGSVLSVGDGHPAYGWVENVRASADGMTLLGDIAGVPAKLAPAMRLSVSRRVVEIEKGRKVGDTTFRALLRAVSMIGMAAPRLNDLNDVLASYSQGQLITLTERTPHMDTAQSDTDRAVATFAGRFDAPIYCHAEPPLPPVVDPDDARAARSFNQW